MKNLSRRDFVKLAGAAAAMTALPGCAGASGTTDDGKAPKKKAGNGGDHYIPYEERKSPESFVYFTRDLSAAGLQKAFDRVSGILAGKVAVKLHTGEPHGP
ncbi:MAG: twin-arginine translocation signal domain-containing protein, partial [Schwartzia sp.]|nr:twin-arginine translocation signal domain-containing protein [Schwartzia sp. (in: firmicutes)]